MSLLQKIRDDNQKVRFLSDPKSRVESTLLITLFSEAQRVGKDNGNRESTDAEVIAVIQKFVKNTNETISLLPDTDPRKQSAKVELAVLEAYLPKQYTKEELKTIISACALNGDDMSLGSLMKFFKEYHAGKYDGKMLSEVIRNDELVQKLMKK